MFFSVEKTWECFTWKQAATNRQKNLASWSLESYGL